MITFIILSRFESDLDKLNSFKREKRLTPCLELLENRGVVGNAAIFVLSQVKTENQNEGGQR
jgi:hypothetical protein